jgi:CheY-like chemotaxis protein
MKQPFLLLPVIQAAVESIREMAAARHITLDCNCPIAEEWIDGDASRVQQAIRNLLSNAIKFTPYEGHVWLSADAGDGQAVITVRDDGIGIAPELLPDLFDRFSQQDSSATRAHGGLGLGLFLARHLIESHRGSITAESAGEGKGARFSITLPLCGSLARSTSCAEVDGSHGQPSLKGLRILLVDDQEDVRESLSVLLASAGAHVFSAASAAEVFDWLPAAGVDELPDVLVCDIAMPMEDGYSILRKLRAWKNSHGLFPLLQMPALALTAFAQCEDRMRALSAGFQMHMPKPVAPEQLIAVIAMMASQRSTMASLMRR